ncbi:MAG: hypothetical protein HFE79_13945 [Ruminiclostridium sp.]|jgi:hypothetical protein|nr:hypothetical protein [Ruminiclostridium sp.]
MPNRLNIIDQQLELGQTKVISRNGGRIIDYVELLFSPTTKAQFAPSEDRKTMRLAVSDNTLELPQMDCLISKKVLRDYILALKNIYNLLEDESEENEK